MTLPARRLFVGHRLRDLRRVLGISQAAMAARIGLSVSYLSQIENGDRPVTEGVLITLAREFPADWGSIDAADDTALLIATLEAVSDTSVEAPALDETAVRRAVKHQPLLAQRLVAMHDAYRRAQEQLRALDDRLVAGSGAPGLLPWEDVRDWFHAAGNYVDTLDRRAEEIGETLGADRIAALEARLATRGVSVAISGALAAPLRDYDGATLRLDGSQPGETTLFSLAHQVARHEFGDVIGGIVAASEMASETARALLTAGLTNYAAGAIVMPYTRFRTEARSVRHDIDRLRRIFGTSFEQTCHRLSTLQRPGALGIPFFFCRVDMAGNITKRHSATRLQFARFGGACPLWIVHEAVAIPDRILTQLIETTDGIRYVSMAKGLVKPSETYTRPARRYAVALGCEEENASEFIYADALGTGGIATPIGSSCRVCLRTDCDQRAFPPAASGIRVDPDRRGAVPYEVL
ncbi:helix-turn-helix domain-containing protein [Sphingomonas sp. M1A8_2b]